MTEEQIREIVRDEIAEAVGGEGGILDDVRAHAFSMVKAILVADAERCIAQFAEPEKDGGEDETSSTAH